MKILVGISNFPKNILIYVIKSFPLPQNTHAPSYMRIIARSTLVSYYTKNPQSKVALEDWYRKTKEAKWECFSDIKKSFNSVDSVGNKRFVFNIKGNDYRLIVLIKFTVSHVFIRFVGTHQEYDKIRDIQNI